MASVAETAAAAESPPRIAFVCADRGIALLHPGGAAVHLRGLARGFRRAAGVGARVGAALEIWIAREAPPDGVPGVDADTELFGIPRYFLPLARMPGILRRDHPAVALRADGNAAARAAVGHARRFRPTLVYERYALGSAAGASVRRALSVPWVLEVNASRAWEAAWADAVPASGALLRREIRTFAAADLLVAVSEPLADWIAAHGIPRERILVCPNGADGPAATAPLADDAPGSSGAAVPPAAERVDPAGPFVLGYAGTWKPWQGTREAIPSLLALAAAVSPCPLRLDLWGDGPCRSEFLSALAVAAGPRVQAVLRGWGSPADLAAARRAWDLAWVPRGPWPPAASSAGVPSADLARAFGEPPPPRFHSPLKEAEALAAGVPLWNGAGAPPLSWDRIAEQILSRIRTLPAPSPPRSRSALLRIWPRAATVGDSGSSAAGDSVRTSEPRAPEGR